MALTNVRIAVLENAPYVTDVAMPWEWLDGKRPNTIHLHPLLLVLGDHAQNDLFGDEEDSVVNELDWRLVMRLNLLMLV